MNPFVSNGNKLRWKFEDVKDLDEIGKFSDKFKIGTTQWKINIWTGFNWNVKYLGVSLCYDDENVNDENWICQMDRKITMINQNENGKNKSKKSTVCYSHTFSDGERADFYKCDNLIKDGYMRNDSIIIEIDFSFKYYDFSKNIPNLTDITLKVGDTEFYTSKAILCNQSEYFYDLFINKKYEESVVEIKDIGLYRFRYFLASFYPLFECVQLQCEILIKLADKYKFPILHKNCENYLLKDTEWFSLEGKLEYADKYDYYDLMKQCIESLDSAQKIKILRNTYTFRNFKESTKLMIMKRILDFY